MKTIRQIIESHVHSMAVHVYPSGKNKFTVSAIGKKVKHVRIGDNDLTSSDLDDLTDAGHKVKEVKKPMNEHMDEEVQQIDELDDRPHGTLNAYRQAMDAVKTDMSTGRYPKNKIKNRERGSAMLARRDASKRTT